MKWECLVSHNQQLRDNVNCKILALHFKEVTTLKTNSDRVLKNKTKNVSAIRRLAYFGSPTFLQILRALAAKF